MSYDVRYCKLHGLCSWCSWCFYHDSFSYSSPLPGKFHTQHYTLLPLDVVFSFSNMTGYSIIFVSVTHRSLVFVVFRFLLVSPIYTSPHSQYIAYTTPVIVSDGVGVLTSIRAFCKAFLDLKGVCIGRCL